jgi:FkbM family methyltransferase
LLSKLLSHLLGRLVEAITWRLATPFPFIERLVQPAPGRPDRVRIAILGKTFEMPDHRWWPKYAMDWEPGTLRAYRALVRPGDTVVDVGAWIGPTVMFACARGARRVLAIEPNPLSLPYLEALADAVRANGTELSICPEGVFSAAGEMDFGMPTGIELLPESVSSLLGRGTRIKVAPLPDLLARYGFAEADFFKIDIEGAEFAIADQIAELASRPGLRVLLSLHPPFAPADIDMRELTRALAVFDLYEMTQRPIAHDEVAARIASQEARPAWGMPGGNIFDLLLAPRGERLVLNRRR